MILEKKVRFNNKNWLVEIENGAMFKVYLCDKNWIQDKKYLYTGCSNGKDLVDMCKNIVLQFNNILFPIDEVREFQNWDGNMDKKLNIKY